MSYTALVAEDEELVRDIAAAALRSGGFIVLEAEHAAAALRHLHDRAATIHVLFTDIHMPGDMDGLLLAHHTSSTWPWIAVLITSGRSPPAAHQMPAGSRFLPKPYHPDTLLTHLRELVGAD